MKSLSRKGVVIEMKIAVMGDLHYPTLDEDNAFIEKDRNEFFSTFIERFFSINADLYVSIGDLTNFGLKDELEDIYDLINKQRKPFIHVLGNHDVYGLCRNEVLSISNQHRYHAVINDKVAMVFLDTTKDQNLLDWGGTLDAEQLECLEEMVSLSGDRPLLVFAHHPVYKTTKHSEIKRLCVDQNILLWETIKKKNGAGLYINGHNHYNSIVKKENWTFAQLAAVLDQQAARVIEIHENEMNINFVDLSDSKLKQQAKTIGENIFHFHLHPEQIGSKKDWEQTIPLLIKSTF